jgi:hypothetical protein
MRLLAEQSGVAASSVIQLRSSQGCWVGTAARRATLHQGDDNILKDASASSASG